MARTIDVRADVLDSEGAWQWVIFRVREDAGCFQGLRPLDYIGALEVIHGGLVGTGSGSGRRGGKDAPVPEWLTRLLGRRKENR